MRKLGQIESNPPIAYAEHLLYPTRCPCRTCAGVQAHPETHSLFSLPRWDKSPEKKETFPTWPTRAATRLSCPHSDEGWEALARRRCNLPYAPTAERDGPTSRMEDGSVGLGFGLEKERYRVEAVDSCPDETLSLVAEGSQHCVCARSTSSV